MFSHRTSWRLTENRFTETQRELVAAGMQVIDLTVSNPTRAGLSYDADTILQAFARPEVLDYDPDNQAGGAAEQNVDYDPGQDVLDTLDDNFDVGGWDDSNYV